ncbi:MAG: hypothetical protein WAO58_03510 [Fimbriimonadaceae bacterium]
MISNAFVLLTAALVLQGQTPPTPLTGAIKLERVYVKGVTDKYDVQVSLNMGGAEGKAVAKVESKVLEELKGGLAQVEMSVQSISMMMQEQEMPTEAPAPIKSTFDKMGMPSNLEVKDEKWVYALIVLSSFAPGQAETGKEFKIAWKSADGSVVIAGTGKVVEIVTVDSKRVAVVKTKMKVTPAEDTPGELELTARLAVATGTLIQSEGKLTVESDGMTASFTIKRAK